VAGACLALLLGLASGCTDRMPTFTGGDQFPGGLLPTTLQFILQPAEYLRQAVTIGGTTGVGDVRFLLVARDFDGGLDAHMLAEFTNFPDTIVVEGHLDDEFTYLGGRVRGTVVDTAQASAPNLTFYLWTITEPWDTTATWEHATDGPGGRISWTTPGGSRGDLLGIWHWVRGDTLVADSLSWPVPGPVVEQLASGELHGLMVTLEDQAARAHLGPLSLEVEILPPFLPDTTVWRTVPVEAQTFVYSPQPPTPAGVLRVGGITSDRSLVRVGLPQALPSCLDPAGTGCSIAPGEVTLNRVDLIFDPVPVTHGFRPTAPMLVYVRQLLEPELGERAPLGYPVSLNEIPPARFIPGAGEPVVFTGPALTQVVLESITRGDPEIGFALQVEPEASTFGYAWFAMNPRLRFIYTLPQRPRLP
jgi:hypothetical protein